MIKTKEEILFALKDKLADTDDSTLELLGDITDTLDDFTAKTSDNTEWRQKYDELDKSWRDKYKARFFSADENNKNITTEPVLSPIMEDKELTYDKLFKGE